MSTPGKNIIVLCALFTALVLTTGSAYAQEEEFVDDPGISDNSPSEWTPPREGGMEHTDALISGGSSSRTQATSSEERKGDVTGKSETRITEKKADKKESSDVVEQTRSSEIEDESVMSFNFLYYLIHKFKFSESIQ